MIWVFGILDLLSAFMLVLLKWNIGVSLAWFLVFYLIIKSIIFLSWLSFLDIGSAIVIILAIFGITNILTWLVFIYLLQKGLLSLFSSSS